MGRYAESNISISLEEGETCPISIQTGDQVLGLYTVKETKTSRYNGRVKSGRNRTNSLAGGTGVSVQDPAYDMGEDKNHCVLYQGGDDYKTYMMKLTEGQEPMMLLDPVFSVKMTRDITDVRPDFAAVSSEGLIFLSHSRVTDVHA